MSYMQANENQKIIHDIETGEVKVVNLSESEIIAKENEALKVRSEIEAKIAKQTEAAAAKAALLEKLGITEEEAKLLLS